MCFSSFKRNKKKNFKIVFLENHKAKLCLSVVPSKWVKTFFFSIKKNTCSLIIKMFTIILPLIWMITEELALRRHQVSLSWQVFTKDNLAEITNPKCLLSVKINKRMQVQRKVFNQTHFESEKEKRNYTLKVITFIMKFFSRFLYIQDNKYFKSISVMYVVTV